MGTRDRQTLKAQTCSLSPKKANFRRYLVVDTPQNCARTRDNPILFTSTAQARQARDAVRRATLAKRKRGFAYEYLRLLCVSGDIINKNQEFGGLWSENTD